MVKKRRQNVTGTKPRMIRVKTESVYDTVTGELVEQSQEMGDAYDWFPDKRGFKFGKSGRNMCRIDKNPLFLPAIIRGHLMAFVKHVGEDGELPNVARCAKVMGVSERQAKRYMADMRSAGVIKWDEESSAYYMNPTYLFTGVYLPPALYRLFQADIDPLITGKARAKYAQLLEAATLRGSDTE